MKKLQEYKIAIVANMSAGKSTFINALFGDNILPAYSHATTDCPIYIYSDDNPDNNMAIVKFTDGKRIIKLSKDEVQKNIKYYAQKDSESLDEKYRNVKKIHLCWDFKVLQNSDKLDTNFVLIDTPGPNNTDDFASKHIDITKDIILNEADMILYLFDYEQIDANLESTEKNLWGLINQRKRKDSNLEVFFVINKIDRAIEDNEKIHEVKNSTSEDEFYQNFKKYHLYHEKKAVDKLKNIAIKHGFKSPKIFTVSSKFIESYRNRKNLNFVHKDELTEFIDFFKNCFGKNWSNEFHTYLGHKSIEKSLKNHLKNKWK